MDRTFAMISTDLLHDNRFKQLCPEDKLLLLTILTSELIDLKGLGKTNTAELAELAGIPDETVNEGLQNLCKLKFIEHTPGESGLLVRNWWNHTSMNKKALWSLIAQLKNGRLSRALRGFEEPWLRDFCDGLEQNKDKRAVEAIELVTVRLLELHESETDESEHSNPSLPRLLKPCAPPPPHRREA